MNKTLEGIHSRITEAQAQINDLEDRMVEITAAEQNIEKRIKSNEDNLRDLLDNIKCMGIHIVGIPEGGEREKGPERILEEIIAENFSNTVKEIIDQVQEEQSPMQDKSKEEHTQIYNNKTIFDKTIFDKN